MSRADPGRTVNPRFALPVWTELSRQRATVLVHPSPFSRPVLYLPTALFEVGFDTARVGNTQQVTAAQIEQAASRFWYDTAMSGSLPTLSALLAVTSPDHVLYGSDFGAPCAGEDVLQHNARLLRTSPLLSPAERDGLGRHGAELFPHAFARMESPATIQG
ncbi:hypothetical protein UK15_33265 [Streptomyces variegatus]|uniref:Amidohydrolase-related domain-containing protein n=1 Tax=Streptomyces variegatus TaxID=284040 RepID=A0A0M2GIZ3_9ACTN|nr:MULTISPECIES: hypothetical protein [Streptomyces]KJK35035.1 hypothetical protein UK15_33265 [Streptomyces variegatus]